MNKRPPSRKEAHSHLLSPQRADPFTRFDRLRTKTADTHPNIQTPKHSNTNMPTPHAARIRSFMQKAGQATPDAPVIPTEEIRILRAKLILEEALETVRGLGVGVRLGPDGEMVSSKATNLDFYIDGPVDLEEVVDGCADISVVTIGTLIAFGIDDEPVLEEVDAANLRKFAPGGHRRADGKWIKPPDWTPPDIDGVIERMKEIIE